MKIAQVTDCHLPRSGGIEMHVHDLTVHQLRAGNDVEVVTGTPGDAEQDPPWVRRLAPEVANPSLRLLAARGPARDLFVPGAYDAVHVHARERAADRRDRALALVRARSAAPPRGRDVGAELVARGVDGRQRRRGRASAARPGRARGGGGAAAGAPSGQEPPSRGCRDPETRCVGLPVVAMAEGGVGEFVTHGREGLLVPDRNGLTEALVRLCSLVAEPAAA